MHLIGTYYKFFLLQCKIKTDVTLKIEKKSIQVKNNKRRFAAGSDSFFSNFSPNNSRRLERIPSEK